MGLPEPEGVILNTVEAPDDLVKVLDDETDAFEITGLDEVDPSE